MTLTRALSNAYSGLATSGLRADVTSSNIANASTPGYVRRNVVSHESVVGGQGNGVGATSIERAQNLALTRSRRDADSNLGKSNVLAEAYATLNRELGTPGEPNGLFASIENLETFLQNLAATPESEALQNAVVAAAKDTSQQFNQLSQLAQSLRQDADRNIQRDVETVNSALYQLQEINRDFGSINEQAGGGVVIEDERQRLIDSISAIIPVKDITRANGQVDIVTDTGVFLLAGKVTELSFTPANSIPSTSRYPASPTLSGLFAGDIDLTPGTTGRNGLTGGSLAGHFNVRDNIAPDFIDNIDALAADLITRFSDDSLDPTKAPGAPGLFTDLGAAHNPVNLTGTAGRLRINAAVDPAAGGLVSRIRDGIGSVAAGDSGDPAIISALYGALTESRTAPTGSALSGNYSVAGLAAGYSSVIGESSLRYDAVNTGAITRQNTLADAELAESGVDTDQELQNLLIIEQAYAANARVIQTVGDMIDRLLQL